MSEKKWEIAGIEPSPFSSEGYGYCTYKNNRNDLTFIHFYANNSIECYWLQASKLNKKFGKNFFGRVGWGTG